MSIDTALDAALSATTSLISNAIFFPIPLGDGAELPLIVGWLMLISLFATLAYRFINLRYFVHGLKLTLKKDGNEHGGSISNFQALSAALAGTVGLGNIAGVAVAISVGGPGACVWMMLMGFLGMSSKFMEATLGVKYRVQNPDGSYASGPMFYLRDGLKEIGLPKLGAILATIFAVCTIGGAIGGGNMFQANQTFAQLVVATGGADVSWWADKGWFFGIILSALVGVVIFGGITKIANVSTTLVPVMALLYVAGCLVVLFANVAELPNALAQIFHSAFSFEAGLGGFLGAVIQGVRRAIFSNEAGVGSCAIVHGVARSKFSAEQGMVAMHGAFIDTVIICTMTALVIVTSGVYDPALKGSVQGIPLTSAAFATVAPWFVHVLALVVFLFAYSTLLTWGYYGATAITFLFGHNPKYLLAYHIFFCLCVVVGSAANLTTVIDLSDALFFAMTIPNVIGLYLLSGIVRRELKTYESHISKAS